ncbi:MAG: Phenylacetic acid catabolic protein [Ktedonobacterales bacterium]
MQNVSLPPATQTDKTEIAHLIARLADNKYFLGRYYAEWCSGAPTLESAVASAAMAQGELGHARALYPLLRALEPEAGIENEPESRTVFASMSCLDEPFRAWEDFVAANFLVDGALTTVFAAAVTSSYEPLAARSRKVLQEERTHAMHGRAWVHRLASQGGAMRTACERSLRRVWPETLCWFGPEDDETLFASGVLDATPSVLRSRFLAVVAPTIAAGHLALPIRQAGESWELSMALPWEDWDGVRYRLSSRAVLCPFCRSRDTEMLSSFGSQLSTEQHYCRSCRTPFEYMRQENDSFQ